MSSALMSLLTRKSARTLWWRVVPAVLVWFVLAASLAAQDNPPGVGIHVVQRGENLYRIAQSYGVPLDTLVQMNGMADPGRLQVGDRLLVPLAVAGGEPQISAPVIALSDEVYHVVLPGETLFRIATQYGASLNAVVEANAITDSSLIYPGQTLLIPGVQPPQLSGDLPPIVSDISIQPQVFVTGRTGMIRLVTSAPAAVSGSFLGRSLRVASDPTGLIHSLIFGLPMDSAAGISPVTLSVADSAGGTFTVSADVQVVANQFATESLTIPDDRLVLLGTEVDAAEGETIRAAMSGYTNDRLFNGLMGLPAAAAVTSPFGSTRSYNGGVLQRLHLGTDFAGAPGSAIFAPADGIVVFSGALDVRGLATIIDHGWGVYTGYWHQTETYVVPSDRVVAGQVIGTIGMSGRATGPHLHWEMWVNGVPVDAMQWVQQSFSP